jgi:acyl dehydratase
MLYFEDFLVGQSRSAGEHELTAQDILAFARQWDPQPWHVDPVAAEQSPMRGLTASSCHTYSIAALLLSRMEPAAGIASLKHEIGLPNPARPGDRLTLTMTCVEKRTSASKPDRGLVAFDGVLANQSGCRRAGVAAPGLQQQSGGEGRHARTGCGAGTAAARQPGHAGVRSRLARGRVVRAAARRSPDAARP